MVKKCRRCERDFETEEPRRTVCDICRPPEVRAQNTENQRLRAALWHRWKPIAPLAEDWHAEFTELAGELQNVGSASTGALAGAIRKLSATEGRAGTRSGLLRVAAIAIALARRLR